MNLRFDRNGTDTDTNGVDNAQLQTDLACIRSFPQRASIAKSAVAQLKLLSLAHLDKSQSSSLRSRFNNDLNTEH